MAIHESWKQIYVNHIPISINPIQSDTEPDRIWSDPTIRRNLIEIRVAESDPILRVGFFCWISLDCPTKSEKIQSNPTLRISLDSTTRIPIKSYKILSDSDRFRWVPYWIRSDPLSDSWTWVHKLIFHEWRRVTFIYLNLCQFYY